MGPEIFRLNFEIELKHWWFRARREILRKLIVQVMPPSPDTSLVDIGCGTGANIVRWRKTMPVSAWTFLPRPSAWPGAASARSAFSAARRPKTSARPCKRPGCSCSTTCSNTWRTIAGCSLRSSKPPRPGSWFSITVPADMTLWSPHDEHHGHYRRYDKRGLEMLWHGLPVATALVSYFNSRMYPLVKIARTINRRLGRTSGDAGTDLRIPHARVNRLERVFVGEADVLAGVLRGVRPAGYRFGVSLVAMLRKLPVTASSAAIPRLDVACGNRFRSVWCS